MKNFEYAAPRTEAEVLELLSELPGQTELLAGGTDLVGLMKKMIVTPERVINIMEVGSLKEIIQSPDDEVIIGATVTLDDVLAHPYLANYQAITDAILGINSMQLQSQGTIGGEICQRPQCWFFRGGQSLLAGDQVVDGDNRFHAVLGNSGPAKYVHGSRIAPALIALDASVRVIGPSESDEQILPIGDFFRTPRHVGQRETILAPNQLLTHFILPPAEGRFNATYEVRAGAGPEYPLASAAASLDIGRDGRVQDARIVLGQVAPVPWFSHAASDVLRGQVVSPESAANAGAAAVAMATPLSQNEYKVDLARVAVKRAVLRAAGLETGGF